MRAKNSVQTLRLSSTHQLVLLLLRSAVAVALLLLQRHSGKTKKKIKALDELEARCRLTSTLLRFLALLCCCTLLIHQALEHIPIFWTAFECGWTRNFAGTIQPSHPGWQNVTANHEW